MVPRQLVLRDVETTALGPMPEFLQWLKTRTTYRNAGNYPQGQFPENHFLLANNAIILAQNVSGYLNTQATFGSLAPIYVLYIPPGGTKDYGNSSAMFNLMTEQPQNPLQRLYANRELQAGISASTERAFGFPLTVNRYGGSEITAHLGTVRSAETPPPASAEYLSEIMKLPQVREQGDGVRAFIGMLLAIATTDYSLLLIDEPETFLHPPQAYLLGQILAEQHHRSTQVIIATHSSDVIRGLTSTRASSFPLSIVRLTRSGSANHVNQIPADAMRALYDDPLIEYYSILDGLFFHGVVLCEGDSDCTYYRAVLDTIDISTSNLPATSAIDLHFTHCGGKARLAKAITALRMASVPVACIVDFDFLQNETEFNDVIRACGGDMAAFRSFRNDIVASITARDTKLRRATAKADVIRIFDERASDEVSAKEMRRIGEALKPRTGWREAKLVGKNMLSGQARSSFDTLNARLHELGVFIVEMGELERFHPDVQQGNKAEWLHIVLEKKLYAQSPNAAKLMQLVASGILARQ